MTTQKYFQKICLFFILILLVFSQTGASCKKQQSTQVTQQGTITIWAPQDEYAVWQTIFRYWQKTNKTASKYKLVYRTIPVENYETELVNALAAKQGPDIFMIYDDWLPKDWQKLEPMPTKTKDHPQLLTVQEFNKAFIPLVSQQMVRDNKIYGLPLSVDPLVLYYNVSLFNKMKITKAPQTWEELIADSEKLTIRNNKEISRSGVALGRADNVQNAEEILSLLMMQFGSQMVTEDKLSAAFHLYQKMGSQGGIDSLYYPGKAALEFYTSFADPIRANYSWNASLPQSQIAFLEGKTAMMFDFSSTQGFIKKTAPDLDYKIANVPQTKEVIFPESQGQTPTITKSINAARFWALSVNKYSPNRVLAWDFIGYANQNQNIYIQKMGGESPNMPQHAYLVEKSPLTTATDWYKGTEPQVVIAAFNNMIAAVNAGKPSQEAINNSANQITALLRQP